MKELPNFVDASVQLRGLRRVAEGINERHTIGAQTCERLSQMVRAGVDEQRDGNHLSAAGADLIAGTSGNVARAPPGSRVKARRRASRPPWPVARSALTIRSTPRRSSSRCERIP